MSRDNKKSAKPRVAMIGEGHLGSAGPTIDLRQGVVMLVVLIEKMSKYFDLSFYSLRPLQNVRPENRFSSYSVSSSWLPVRIRTFLLMVKILFSHLKNPFDIIHAVSPFPAGRIAIILGWIIRRPVFVHLIGDEMVYMPEIGYGQLLRPKLNKINKWVCRNAAEVIALTEYQKKIVEKNIDFKREVKALPLQTDLDKINFSPNPLSFPIQFIHVANFHFVKDQITVLKAFSKIAKETDCFLTMVGEGFEAEPIQELLRELNMDDKIIFTKAIPQPEVIKLLSKSQIMLQASRYESQFTAVMEALASGVVVCGPAIGVLADNESLGVIVPPANPDALAEAVLTLLKDQKKYEQLQKDGRKFMESYSSDKTSLAYVDLFNRWSNR